MSGLQKSSYLIATFCTVIRVSGGVLEISESSNLILFGNILHSYLVMIYQWDQRNIFCHICY